MVKKTYSILIIFFLVCTANINLLSKTNDKDFDSNFDIGFIFKAGSSEIQIDDLELENELAFLITALRVDFEISSYIKLGIIAGFQQNHFNNPINAVKLPLSLSVPEENSNSMLFGFIINSEPFSLNDLSLDINFEFDYYKSFLKSWKIDLPINSGTAETKNSFYRASINFLFKYDGFSSFTPYIGPVINRISGQLNFSESIMGIEASEEMKYKQKRMIGLSSGVVFELGDNWDIEIRLNLFSEKSLYLSAFYIF